MTINYIGNNLSMAKSPSAVVYYFCHGLSLRVCPGEFFIAAWPIFGERNCLFGFLFVVFLLWCFCIKCVLLSLWCLGRKVLDNCIDS